MGNKIYCLLIFFIGIKFFGQDSDTVHKNSFFIAPEIVVGKTGEANTGFPDTEIQKSLFVSFGVYTTLTGKSRSRLKPFKTGFSLGITDFGNIEKLGLAYTLMPFSEFKIFQKYSNRWSLDLGLGVAYLDTQFDADRNAFNKAITTKINWAFRSFIYYDLIKKDKINWRMGLGYAHFSNGHTRLPNQGLNSFLISLSSSIGNEPEMEKIEKVKDKQKKRFSETYFSFRTGIGQNVLSQVFNDKKEVYSIALSAGKILNKRIKLGTGIYYRFYEHYYDHIKNDGQLISEQVPEFKENPYRYATNLGVFVNAELLLGHFGTEFELGINIHKPFYKIDWQLSQGFFFRGEYTKLGELDWYYKVKRTVSSRLGIKYYLINTYKSPVNNVFLGANINANLGQADFSEFSIGYVYRLKH